LLYEKIMEGDYDRDFVDVIRGWVIGRIDVESSRQYFKELSGC